MSNNTLSHAGIKGMKWGLRRFQNKDGSLTPEGKKRYGSKDHDESDNEPHEDYKRAHGNSTKTMSDRELEAAIKRIENEQKYMKLRAEDVSRGKQVFSEYTAKFARGTADTAGSILKRSVENIGTQALTYFIGTQVNKKLGSDYTNPKKGQKDK